MKNKYLIIAIKAALLAALSCVCTMAIPVPLPGGGFAHLGDTMVIAAGFFLGPLYGFLAAGIGSMLADVFLGYAVYAPATFVIKGLMAVVVALICRKHKGNFSGAGCVRVVASGIAAEALMVAGYFIYGVVLYSLPAATVEIPGNLVQAAAGIVLSAVLINLFTANKQIMKLAEIK